MSIAWRDAMSIGAPEIDADHKRFVALVNACEKTIQETNPAVGQRLFELVIDYTQQHFKKEELFMLSSNSVEYERHKKMHQVMTDEARTLWRDFLAEADAKRKMAHIARLHETMSRWLVEHMLKEDLKLRAVTGRKVPLAQPKAAAPAAAATNAGGVSAANDPRGIMAVQSRTGETRQANDIEYRLPPHLAHLLHRLKIVTPKMPPLESGFTDFNELCAAAIRHRINRILVFFQRGNPDIQRKFPPIFLASAAFAEKFHAAVKQFVMPVLMASRQIKMMSSSVDLANLDTENFWDQLTPLLKTHILLVWRTAWEDMRLVEGRRADGTRVLQVKEETKRLRQMLTPDSPEDYDLPKVSNREIELFISLLDTGTDWWQTLNQSWTIVQDIYEQEKDPRVFQDRIREGALRDNLLNAFRRFPDMWGDFLILASHRTFPRISTQFLESFSTNLGRNEAEREAYIPYTVRYLRQVRDEPSIREEEIAQEELWQKEMEELRKYLKGMDMPGASSANG